MAMFTQDEGGRREGEFGYLVAERSTVLIAFPDGSISHGVECLIIPSTPFAYRFVRHIRDCLFGAVYYAQVLEIVENTANEQVPTYRATNRSMAIKVTNSAHQNEYFSALALIENIYFCWATANAKRFDTRWP